MLKKKIALLVTSFDGFNDLWSPLDKNYGIYVDKNIDCYLMTNFLKPDLKILKYLAVGKDLDWSQNLKNALNHLGDYEFIFLTLDDVFFESELSYKEIENYCDLLIKSEANYLSLLDRPSSKFMKKNKDFAYISKDSLYPVSAGLCIWRTNQLTKFLNEKQNAWQYERNFKIDDERKYISLTKDFKKLIHAVVKGKFYPSALKKLSKQGIDLNSDRQTYSWIVEKAYNLRDYLRSSIIGVFAKLNLLFLIKLARKYINKT